MNYHTVAYWNFIVTDIWEIWLNIGSANDLLADGIKPLPKPMLMLYFRTNYADVNACFSGQQLFRFIFEYQGIF